MLIDNIPPKPHSAHIGLLYSGSIGSLRYVIKCAVFFFITLCESLHQWVPLHTACRLRNYDVRYFVDHGADVNAQDDDGVSE